MVKYNLIEFSLGRGAKTMPVIKIEITKQTKEKKKEIIERVTETMSDITDIPEEAFTIYVNEYEAESIGVGGVPLSEKTKDI